MNRHLFIVPLVFLMLPTGAFSQNLIPNGDFELGPDTSSWGWQLGIDSNCINFPGTPGPDYWIVTSQSPDRLYEWNFPSCNWDNDSAQSGNAYVVFGNSGSTAHEAGKTTLSSPLQKDSTYHLSYYIKLETFGGLSLQPVRIAFRFNMSGDSLASSLVTDTLWQYRDTIFIASENSTEIEIMGIDSAWTAVDIDNIKLKKISPNRIGNYFMKENIKISPNPVKDILFIELMKNESPTIKVFYCLGNEADNYSISKNNYYSLNLSSLPSGIYFINIVTQHKSMTEKFFLLK